MKKSRILVVLLALCMLFLFTACNGGDYKNATALLDEGKYEEAISAFEALGDYKDSAEKLEQAKAGLKREQTMELLSGQTWFFNGGSDSTVNNITFTKESAIIGQTYFDGNGSKTNDDVICKYTIGDENITVILADTSELKISYEIEYDKVKLGENEYFTVEEVEKGLQGYWILSEPSHEYIYYYNNGKVKFESAAAALGYNDGSYYYYGPHEGTYVMDSEGLTVDARNNWQFGFNIIDGEVKVLRCDKVCQRTDGFKGEDGFKF